MANEISDRTLYNDIQEIKQTLARITTVLEERQFHCNDHQTRIARNEKEITLINRSLSGLKAWITAAGLIGGVIGWISNNILGR